jgi:translation initiation factor 1
MAKPKSPSKSSSDPPRIDVSSAPALTQSPFAKLAGLAAPAAPTTSSGASSSPAPAGVPPPAKKPARGKLILRRETKHRGGKTVVLISGFAQLADHGEKRLVEVERHLKQRLGCGGSLDMQAREILIQGDRPEEIATLLRDLGYDVGGVTTSPRR